MGTFYPARASYPHAFDEGAFADDGTACGDGVEEILIIEFCTVDDYLKSFQAGSIVDFKKTDILAVPFCAYPTFSGDDFIARFSCKQCLDTVLQHR